MVPRLPGSQLLSQISLVWLFVLPRYISAAAKAESSYSLDSRSVDVTRTLLTLLKMLCWMGSPYYLLITQILTQSTYVQSSLLR